MHYYKILNESENHNGFQYKDGLNIDTQTFNPSGSCEPGGIYFSRKDILTFLDYGVWLRQVTLPKNAQIYKDPGPIEKWKADRVILSPRQKINANVIQRLIEEGADPKAWNSQALRWAAENGHTKIVEMLIPVSDPQSHDSQALRWAAEIGHTKIVEMLIPVSDPKARNSGALRWAAKNGHTKIVEMLIPVSDPKACNSEALRLAAENGHTKIVKLLKNI